MKSMPRTTRDPFRLLLCAPLLLASLGCDVDDTVRGAGSIDVPKEALKYQPPTKPVGAKARSRQAR